MKKIIQSDAAPKAVGPYSQGVAVNGFLFLSGQIPINPVIGKLIAGGVKEQTRQVLLNIDALLKDAGLRAEHVVKATVFLTDISKFTEMNQVYAEYFCAYPPARSCVEVSKLPLGAQVEIEVVAALQK
ncbi:MAG: RidA family protein [Firmicutes bacterium]|nr:RidA family protein [Bacillota bacterium]